MRQALGELERDGLLRRVVGRAGGTFVREPDGRASSAGGAGGSRPSCAVRVARRASSRSRPRSSPPAGGWRPRSSSSDRERVVVITRLRLAGGKPLAVERSSLPARLFSDIEDMDLERLALRPDGRRLRPAAGQGGRAARARGGAARPTRGRSASGATRRCCSSSASATRPTGRPVEFARDRFRADRTRHRASRSAPRSESEVERPRRRHRRRRRRVLDPLLARRGSAGTTSSSSSAPT